jgi:hypothetical protein
VISMTVSAMVMVALLGLADIDVKDVRSAF